MGSGFQVSNHTKLLMQLMQMNSILEMSRHKLFIVEINKVLGKLKQNKNI